MEEILASIRRIIADDQEGPKAAQPAPPPAAPVRPAAPPPAPPPLARLKAEEEVLDLADIATPVPPRAAPLEMEHEDISFRDTDEFDAAESEKDEAPEAAWDPEPEPEAEPEPVRAAPPPPPPQPEPAPERLISTSTDASVNNAFNMLAHTVLSNNARTLEDLVKEMLKPMLKSWLDDNLPTLVERLVRAEIERVTRGR
jgi:cell pole-organizing protein PopZ